MSISKHRWPVMILAATLVTACDKREPQKTVPLPAAAPAEAVKGGQHFDPAHIDRGAQLFEQHCSVCHGPRGQGHPDWQTPSDRFAAAPPLDGTGNDWKRSRAELAATIKNGVQLKDGTEVMPRWRGRMSDQEVEDIVTWLQSLWAPEVYDKWLKAQASEALPTLK